MSDIILAAGLTPERLAGAHIRLTRAVAALRAEVEALKRQRPAPPDPPQAVEFLPLSQQPGRRRR